MKETSLVTKRICFIVNPVSGRRSKNNIEKLIYSSLDQKKYTIDIKKTASAGHARKLCKQAIASKNDIIVAVGGDGTINEVASELVHTDGILGIIPHGSGNGLARHLGIPLVPQKALDVIIHGKSTKIDTALVNKTRFISIAGVGFDALIAKEFAKNNKRGFITYFSLVTEKFLNYRSKKYKLFFPDGTERVVRAFFIAFANSNQFGYNTQISPNASLKDGKLDICIVKKPRLKDMTSVLNLLLLKKADNSTFVEIMKSENVLVKRSKNRPVNLDGEAVKISKDFNVTIDPQSLNILISNNG